MSRIYVGTRGGLLVIEEDDPRAMRVQFPGSRVETVVVDPARPNRVYAGLYSGQEIRGLPDLQSADGLRGVWRSDDAGATWSDVSTGLDQTATVSLAIRDDGGEFGVLYAGSEPSSLAVARDGGASWQRAGDLTALPSSSTWAFPPRPDTHHVRWISLDPVERDHLYLCIEAGAFIQSHDGGTSWVDRTPDSPIDTHTLAVHPLAPGRLYSAAGDGLMQHGRGYAESLDRGATWVRYGNGLRHHYLYGLAVDSTDPDTILVSAATSPD